MKKIASLALLSLLSTLNFSAYADDSVVGLWKNIDDQSGKPKALIRITEMPGGGLQGKIEKLFRDLGEDQNPKCDKCDGANKDQPILGMAILSGFTKDGNEYKDGKILDPNNGKTYQSKLKLNGNKLNVRGYIGFSLLGRSQVWIKEP